jgi:hypothetical protein
MKEKLVGYKSPGRKLFNEMMRSSHLFLPVPSGSKPMTKEQINRHFDEARAKEAAKREISGE